MNELIQFQNSLIANMDHSWKRFLFPVMEKKDRLTGIKGLRGVGKTTMFLQYLAMEYSKSDALYVTADHPYFYTHKIFDLATEWSKYNGKLLLIDEVHKYPNWSRELKLVYDSIPDLQVFFTSSSALDLYRGESDLSRRLVVHQLPGLSFREYLSLFHGIHLKKLTLDNILLDHHAITMEYTKGFKVLFYFEKYLKEGYFPFLHEAERNSITDRIIRIINTVLESDLASIEHFSASNVIKIKKLLGVIAESAPFEPNISKIAERLGLGRNTVLFMLKNLDNAKILNLISRQGRGISALQKPDKIYVENCMFNYALQPDPDKGTIRETFFINQVRNAGYDVRLSPGNADFMVEGKYTFEVGGKNKKGKQLQDSKNGFLVKDGLEHGFKNTIPLWLFGMLY